MDTKNYTAEQKRELGKAYFFQKEDLEKRQLGLKLLLQAVQENDPEACYVVARLLLDGVISHSEHDSIEVALEMLCVSANNGFLQARTFLNGYCDKRYQKVRRIGSILRPKKTALVDFDGEPIHISCRGIQTPIDAVLTQENGRAVLQLSLNVLFLGEDDLREPARFRETILEGIMAWQGDYEVFNGQPLSVRINVTQETRLVDSLIIAPLTRDVSNMMLSMCDIVGGGHIKSEMRGAMASKRSFAFNGPKWTVNSRKFICIQSQKGDFTEYDSIRHIAKHEFGHALGLGDLYANEGDNLAGVEGGAYPELDCYRITDRHYNLVMCDHNGPISNNDIEMVVLAFRENRMQLYQPCQMAGAVSAALGKGN